MEEYNFNGVYEEVLAATKEKIKKEKYKEYILTKNIQSLMFYINIHYKLGFRFDYKNYNFEIYKYDKWHKFTYDRDYIYYKNKKLVSTKKKLLVQSYTINNIIERSENIDK